jgi:diguanylate cyclase (GGDEF)-like protein/PAS domain S-box-containing protein
MSSENFAVFNQPCPVLHESGCRYLHVFHHVPVSLAVIDPRTNKYLEVNQTLCDRLKYSREEMLQETVASINPRFDASAMANLVREVEEKQVVQLYGHQTTRHGEDLEVWMTVVAIYRDTGLLLHCSSVDVSAQTKAERESIASERRFQDTFEQAAVGIAHVALDGTLLRVNQRFCDIVGYSETELRQLKFEDITYADDLAADWAQAKALVSGEIATYSMEKRYVTRKQTLVWVNITCSVARTEMKQPEYFISVVEDISARKRIEAERDELIRTLEAQVRRRTEELERISMSDPLTGIANRRRFDELLEIEWARGVRSGQPLSVILIDVDHFKSLNDHLGHARGDDCMIAIAQALQGISSRCSDLVSRYGGDEFVFLLPETDSAGAERLAEKTRAAIAALTLLNPGAPGVGKVTLSVGLATTIPSLQAAPRQLLEDADQAMYAAKRQGRNRVVLSTPA